MRLALKVDVDTLRGTLEGVPELVRMLKHHGVNATFLFSRGPDIQGVPCDGFLARIPKKVMRTSVGANYPKSGSSKSTRFP